MPVTFVLGRAGTGKTHICRTQMQAALRAVDDPARLLLIVPEQASFQMERALAASTPGGVYARAEVLSFSRLAWRVFDAVGGTQEVLRPSARTLALRRVVQQTAAELHSLGPHAAHPGFIQQLDGFVSQLLREDLTAADLRAAGQKVADGRTAARLRDLATLFERYLAWLGPQRIDPAAQLSALRERLPHVPWLKGSRIWVDGFAGFTMQELGTLVALAQLAAQTTITLLVDPAAPAIQRPTQSPDPLGLFQHTESTYQQMHRMLAAAGVAVQPPLMLDPPPPRFAAAPALTQLEAGLAQPISTGVAPLAGVPAELMLRACTTPRDELRAAANWIRTTIANSGGTLRFRDFALIARDLAPFTALAREVFEEYEIPYFLDERRAVRAHPLVRLVAALLDCVRQDLPPEAVTRALRSGLLPFPRAVTERLENLLAETQAAGRKSWSATRWQLEAPNVKLADNELEAARTQFVAALVPLFDLHTAAGGAPANAWARALHQTLHLLHVSDALQTWIHAARGAERVEAAELHRLAWDALVETLEDLHDTLGDAPLQTAEVHQLVTDALASQTRGVAPPTIDQVLISAIERSRHPEIQYAWIIGFNEGQFPAPPADDRLLSTAERLTIQQAGLSRIASHRDDAFGERLLAYIACTRPARGLTISWARLAEDGTPLLPSPLLHELRALAPALPVTEDDPHAPPAHRHALVTQYLTAVGDARQPFERLRCATLLDELKAAAAVAADLDWRLRGTRYENDVPALGNYRAAASPDAAFVWYASPSEIETRLQCPFKHWVQYGLRLQSPPGPLPLRWDLGSAAHAVLADVTRRAIAAQRPVREIADDEWLGWLAAAVAAFWATAKGRTAGKRADFAFLGSVLMERLRDGVLAQADRWRRGAFNPIACEQEFSPAQGGPGWQALRVTLADGAAVGVRGLIDRVDVARVAGRTLALVYDYKSSGPAGLRQGYLTGDRLQLFLYLAAVAQGLPDVAPVAVGGVFLVPLYPNLKVLSNKYAAEADEATQRMYMLRPRGICTEDAARALDRDLSTTQSPVAQLQLTKSGSFHSRCDGVAGDELAAYVTLATETVRAAAATIRTGAADVAPLVENRTLACRNCDYRAVCRFDRVFNTPRGTSVLPQRTAAGEGGDDAVDA